MIVLADQTHVELGDGRENRPEEESVPPYKPVFSLSAVVEIRRSDPQPGGIRDSCESLIILESSLASGNFDDP